MSGIDKRRDAFSPSDALLALPHADTDPILRAAVARLRVCSPEEVLVAIVETYSADRARLMAVATEALTKSPPIIFAGDAGDNSRLTRERDEARADGAREMRERAAAEAMRGNGGVTHAELATIHAVAAKSLAGALDTPEARIAYLLEAHPHAGACELVAWLIRALPIVEVPA